MKLVRFGAAGREKPGVVDSEGRIRDLSGLVPDIAGEVLFAQGVAYYSFKQPLSARELSGIALIVIGVALLVAV